jgi:hypothetical protein
LILYDDQKGNPQLVAQLLQVPVKARIQLVLASALVSICQSLCAQVTLLTTFTNPSPATTSRFGIGLSPMGTNGVVIGAYGGAFLFQQDGTLLKTYTDPDAGAIFGSTVAAVGMNALVIGAYANNVEPSHGGAAYLFSTDGTLRTTFTNPVPGDMDYFGADLAAMGNDKVLIGAPGATDLGVERTGMAYLFSTNGMLLTTFTNPSPAYFASFGAGVAAVGEDLVIIGATGDIFGANNKTGIAYLFDSSGTLLTTITNPTPNPHSSERFGFPVLALGTDKLLVGAAWDIQDEYHRGALYLYSTNGTLLTTITNSTITNLTPEPGSFGQSVAVVGADTVLIGDYVHAELSGAAYLFRTDGTLLNTITNPMPQSPTQISGDRFGLAIASVGQDKVLIGADGDDAAGADSGVAYLYSIDLSLLNPKLRISPTSTDTIVVAWAAPSTGWTLQSNTNLTTNEWTDVTNAVVAVGGENQVTLSPMSGQTFFRLLRK